MRTGVKLGPWENQISIQTTAYSLASISPHTMSFIIRRTLTAAPRTSFRALSTSAPSLAAFNRPAPPPLPRSQQKDFEELLRRVNAPASQAAADFAAGEGTELPTEAEATNMMHPQFRAKLGAEFEGEVNPITGESGGSKREPLKHGESYTSREGRERWRSRENVADRRVGIVCR